MISIQWSISYTTRFIFRVRIVGFENFVADLVWVALPERFVKLRTLHSSKVMESTNLFSGYTIILQV